MTPESDTSNALPFSFFVSLLYQLSRIPPRSANSVRPTENQYLETFRRWTKELHRLSNPLPIGTSEIVFRLLFPEEDVRRKYGLQEKSLARLLAKSYGLAESGRGKQLMNWNGNTSSGCLGSEVQQVLETMVVRDVAELSLANADALLTELASKSAYSEKRFRTGGVAPRTRLEIITSLYSSLPARDASFMTQIILKDLRPLLYPVSQTHYSISLNKFNSKAVTILTKEDTMRVWDPSCRLLQLSRTFSCLDDTLSHFTSNDHISPCVGTAIEIPKSTKGRGCFSALKYFGTPCKVWAETKYDGERAQIHVQVNDDGSSKITIFSKSKRDSTLDRYDIHGTIRAALGLPHVAGSQNASTIKTNVVLDAEMVAYSDIRDQIDEFWRIRSLIDSTARGVRGHRMRNRPGDDVDDNSQASMVTDASDNGSRHLALVFFDILMLNSVPLISKPYGVRRTCLESTVNIIHGHSMLAARDPIKLSSNGVDDRSYSQLKIIFARIIADHQEGLVLKADDSVYNDRRLPWVKLKKDYIPGLGDALDMVVIGAGWDKERARELRVGPSVFTTFYIGVRVPSKETEQELKPRIHAYFVASYGLSREQLEEFNFLIKSSDPIDYKDNMVQSDDAVYTFSLLPGLSPPSVIFPIPLLAEVCGAGFTKSPRSRHYELRFPRIEKVHRASERDWREGVASEELHRIAREAIGRDRPNKDVDDWAKGCFGLPTSPGVKSTAKRRAAERKWEEKLASVEKRPKLVDTRQPRGATENGANTKGNLGQGVPLLMHESSPAKGLRALRSMTNVGGQGCSPAQRNPPSGGLIPAGEAPTHISSEGTPSPPFTPPRHQRMRAAPTPESMSRRACASSPHERCLQYAAEDVDERPSHPVLGYADKTSSAESKVSLRDLLQDALVWVPKHSSNTNTPERALLRSSIPSHNYIHSLDALLVGCGWRSTASSTAAMRCPQPWVKRGIVFLEDEGSGASYQWREYTLQVLRERQRAMAGAATRRPIVALSLHALGELERGEDMTAMMRYEQCVVFRLE